MPFDVYCVVMTFFRHTASGPGAAGDIWVTTMNTTGSGTLAATHTAWSTFVASVMSGGLGAILPNDTQITDLRTDQLDSITGKNNAQVKSGVALVGTGAGATLSPRDALVIGLRSSLPTRMGRGRMFWPAPDAGHLTSTGLLVGADATIIANAFGNAMTTFKATAQPIVLHRKIHPLTYEIVLTVTVGTVLGTQRRRSNKVTQTYASKTI
jgi:hypothetical protein